MDSGNAYKKFENEETTESKMPPPYQEKQGIPQSTHVVVTQPTPGIYTAQKMPPTYLWLSLVAVIFCWPMAFCALYLSHQSAYAAGAMDYTVARKKGQKAMRISIGAIVFGVILLGLAIAFAVVKYHHRMSHFHGFHHDHDHDRVHGHFFDD